MRFNIDRLKELPEETEGVWVDYAGEARVKIARMNNRNHETKLRRVMKENRTRVATALRGEDEDFEDMPRSLQALAMSGTVLISWEEFDHPDGSPAEFTEELAAQWLTDYREFYNDIVSLANDREIFEREHRKRLEGNSPGASNGSTSGDHSKLPSEK